MNVYLPALDLKNLVTSPLIDKLYIFPQLKYARGYLKDGHVDTFFPSFYDQVSLQFINNHFAENKNTLDLLVTNADPVRVVYERFLENGSEYFRCPGGDNKILTKEIAINCRTSVDPTVVLYNGRIYKVDVFERIFFSIAYLCKTYMKQSEKGINITPAGISLLDGMFLADSNIEYNSAMLASLFSCEEVTSLLGPVELNVDFTNKYDLNSNLLRLLGKNKHILVEEEETAIEEAIETIDSKKESNFITLNQLMTGSFENKGYSEVMDIDKLKGVRGEVLPIKLMYVVGESNDIFIELKSNVEFGGIIDNDYIAKTLEKYYGIYAKEIFQ